MTTAKPDKVRCPHCDQFKPRSAFHRALGRSSGVQVWCKSCRSDTRSDKEREFPNFDRSELSQARYVAWGRLQRAHPQEFDRYMATELARLTGDAPDGALTPTLTPE